MWKYIYIYIYLIFIALPVFCQFIVIIVDARIKKNYVNM